MTTLQVGDRVTFDHFGAKGRKATVVKLTGTAVILAWTAPSSGVTREVRVRHVQWPGRDASLPTQLEQKNVTLLDRAPAGRRAG